MRTKLCPHIIGTSADAVAYVRTVACPYVLLVDDWGAADQYKALGCTVVGRHTFSEEPQPDSWASQIDPIATSRNYYADRYGIDVASNPSVDAWLGPNEPVCKTPNGMAWYGEFEAERVRLLRRDGKRAVIGNFSVGQPEPELWPCFFPAIEELWEPGGFLGLHEYSEPCRGFDTWYMGRFTRAPKEVKKLITECGTDGIPPTDTCPAGQSWKAQFGEGEEGRDAYAAFMHNYDGHLQLYPDVEGAFIFTSGRLWENHNIEGYGILSRLAAMAGQSIPPEEEPLDVTKLRNLAEQVKVLNQQMLDELKPWWERPVPFTLANPNKVIQFYHADGTSYRFMTVTWEMTVTQVAGDLLLVYDPIGTSNDLWCKAADVTLK